MLPTITHDNLLVGVNTADDAGVYKLTDDISLIQTVDIITPVVDDPYNYGQIAAANSLSDVYAMGGKPVTALNILGFPKKFFFIEVMAEILKGAVDKANEADCPIVGGHTILDDELKFGLSVTGVIHPERIITNNNAQPGDKLILTKPLGLGILTTALKMGKASEEIIQKVTSVMSTLNKTAAELMVSFETHSATDITGFGLLGHAYRIAKGSEVSMILYADKIPYLSEALTKVKEFIPGGSFENKMFLENYVTFSDGIGYEEQMIFFDAQTSGGLLISVHPDSANELLNSLHDNGLTESALIGEVIKEEAEMIRVIR